MLDQFGSEVNLNFDQKGEYHKTIIGGIFSISLSIIILIYGGMRLNVLFNNLEDQDMSMMQVIDPNIDLGQIDINQTGMLFFIQLEQDHFNMTNLTIQNLISFIDIYYEQSHNDYTNNSNNRKQKFNVKFCTQADFGSDQQSIKIFQSFNGQYILCPDIPNGQGLYQQTQNNGNILDSFKLEIVHCKISSRNCASQDQMMNFMKDLLIVPYIFEKQMDFNQYTGEPVFKQLQQLNPIYPALNPVNSSYNFITFIRQNLISTQDAILQLGQLTYQGQFFDLGKQQKFFKPEYNTGTILRWIINLDEQQVQHSRQTYSILQLLGDVGGVMSVLTLIISIFINPFAEYSYKIKQLKRLYLVKTTDQNLMKPQSLIKNKNKHLFNGSVHNHISPTSQNSLQNHRVIQLSLKDYLLLYISQSLGKIFCDQCWWKNQKLKKILEIGNQKIESELNIVKIVKDLRNLKIIINNFLLNPNIKFEIEHAEENLIDIDESEIIVQNLTNIGSIKSLEKSGLELIQTEDHKIQSQNSQISQKLRSKSILKEQFKMHFQAKIQSELIENNNTQTAYINYSQRDSTIINDFKMNDEQNHIDSSIKNNKSQSKFKNQIQESWDLQ